MSKLYEYIQLIFNQLQLQKNNKNDKLDEVMEQLDTTWYYLSDNDKKLSELAVIVDDVDVYNSIMQSWKDFHKENKHKKYRKDYEGCACSNTKWREAYFRNSEGKYECKEPLHQFMTKSDLTRMHHFIYCIIRGRDLKKYFSMEAVRLCALYMYSLVKTDSREYEFSRNCKSTYQEFIRWPFGEALTNDHFLKIHMFVDEFIKQNKIDRWSCYTGYEWNDKRFSYTNRIAELAASDPLPLLENDSEAPSIGKLKLWVK